jgi:hypothetical protein
MMSRSTASPAPADLSTCGMSQAVKRQAEKPEVDLVSGKKMEEIAFLWKIAVPYCCLVSHEPV